MILKSKQKCHFKTAGVEEGFHTASPDPRRYRPVAIFWRYLVSHDKSSWPTLLSPNPSIL